MKGINIKVRPAPGPDETFVGSEFLIVQTRFNEAHEMETTVSHIISKPGNTDWHVRTIDEGGALSHKSAIEKAVLYAVRKGVPVVYEHDETGKYKNLAHLDPTLDED